jgi:hypothetical protein
VFFYNFLHLLTMVPFQVPQTFVAFWMSGVVQHWGCNKDALLKVHLNLDLFLIVICDFGICLCCRGGSCMSAFSKGRGTWRREPWGCSQTLGEHTSIGTSPYVNNSFLISLLLSHFVERKYFQRNMGTYKIGELPWHNALGFFCLGRSLKIHRKIKRELFTSSWMLRN